jgi:hypothetical protein
VYLEMPEVAWLERLIQVNVLPGRVRCTIGRYV